MKKIYLIIFCLVLSSCSEAKPKVTYNLDGGWSGHTSDGHSVYIVIEDNGFRVIDITFELSNCPFVEHLAYYHVPQYAIKGSKFSIESQYLSINGKFDSESSVSGNLNLSPSYCDGNINMTWDANKTIQSSILPSGQPLPDFIKLPESRIPSHLFNPNSSTNGFGKSPIEPFSQGDWDLSIFWLNYAYIPIPRGWTVLETADQMVIYPDFNNSKDAPPVLVSLGVLESKSNDFSIENAFSNLETESQSTILLEKTIDPQKGYFLGRRELQTGDTTIHLVVISRDPSGIFNYIWVSSSQGKWKEYFPIMQDMIEYWMLNDGTPMGFALPDSLSDQ